MLKPAFHRLEHSTLWAIPEYHMPVCRFCFALSVGAQEDPLGGSGIHQLLVELLLRGTTRQRRSEFHRDLERMGSTLSAWVSSDSCGFRGVALRRHLPATLGLLADALTSPRFDPIEFADLRHELLALIASEHDNDEALAELWSRRAFSSGLMVARRDGGEPDDIARIALDDVRELYVQRFSSAERIGVATGDITVDPFQFFDAQWPLSRGEHPSKAPRTPSSGTVRILLVDARDRDQVQLRIALPGPAPHDPAAAAFTLGATAFAGMFSSPFTHAVRDKRGWSYTAHGEWSRLGPPPQTWTLISTPHRSRLLECLALELDLLSELLNVGLTAETIEFARVYLRKRLPHTLASAVAYMGPMLRSAILGLSPDRLVQLATEIDRVPVEVVSPTIRRLVGRSAPCIVAVGSVAGFEAELRRTYPNAQLRCVDHRDTDWSPFHRLV